MKNRVFDNGLFLGLLVVCALVAGCTDEQKEPGVYVDEAKSILMKDLSPRDVIVRVNGKEITKRDFQVRRSLHEKVYRLHNNYELAGKNKRVRNHIRAIEGGIPDEYIRHELYRQAADAEGVAVPEKLLNSEFKKFLQHIGKPKASKEDVAAMLGKEEFGVLMAFMRDAIRAEILRDKLATNGYYVVSDEMVSNHLDKISRWNANAKRLNDKARTKALNFKKKVLAGADFAELGQKTAQIRPEYAKEWDSIQIMELNEDAAELRDWLKAANVGDISDPLDFDDGIAIVKVLDKTQAPVPKGAPPAFDYSLARCTFKAYQFTQEETADEVRRNFRIELQNALMQKLGEKLWKAAVIEFPNGVDFFGKVSKTPDDVEKTTNDVENAAAPRSSGAEDLKKPE